MIKDIAIILLFLFCMFNLVLTIDDTPEIEYLHYAEGYISRSNNDPLNIQIDVNDKFYNITNITIKNYYGFTWEDYGITAQKTAFYRFEGTISLTGGNAGKYFLILRKNQQSLTNCGMETTTQNNIKTNVGFTCLGSLSIGDHLNLMVKDNETPTQDLQIYQLNLNIVEIETEHD